MSRKGLGRIPGGADTQVRKNKELIGKGLPFPISLGVMGRGVVVVCVFFNVIRNYFCDFDK